MQQAKPLHIFKPGQFTAMSGASYTFGEAELRAIAAAYDPALHEAPLTVGHPQHDLPAHGWVQGLAFHEGDDEAPAGLYALPAQVNPGFAEMVAAGAFKKISAAFYAPDAAGNPKPGGYYLRHVGFLGAQPPAVKGLRNPAFSDTEAGVVAFGELAFSPPTPKPQESAVTEQEAAELRAQNTALQAQNTALQAAAQQAAATQRHTANLAFCEGLVAEGRLLSSAAPVMVATLDHLAGAEAAVEFGEGDAKGLLLDQLKAQLKAAPQVVKLGEVAAQQRAAGQADSGTKDNPAFAEGSDPARLAQHRQIEAHAAQHKLSYADAALALLTQ